MEAGLGGILQTDRVTIGNWSKCEAPSCKYSPLNTEQQPLLQTTSHQITQLTTSTGIRYLSLFVAHCTARPVSDFGSDLQRLLAKIPEWSANAPVSAPQQAHTATDAIQLQKLPEVPTAAAPASSDELEAPQPEEAPHQDEAVRPKAVCIATPSTLHFLQALECLEAGAHVLCEKPLVGWIIN